MSWNLSSIERIILFPWAVHWIPLFYLKQISSKCREATAGVCRRCSFDVCFALLSAGVGEWHWGLKDRALWSRCSFPSFPFPFPPPIPHIFLLTLVIISLLEWGYIKKREWKEGRHYAQRSMKNPLCGFREEWNSNLFSVSTLCFERLSKFRQVETLLLSCKLQIHCIWSGWFIRAMRIKRLPLKQNCCLCTLNWCWMHSFNVLLSLSADAVHEKIPSKINVK